MDRYFLINKPRGVVSQFVSPDAVGLLGDLPFNFPPGTHAVGRLDKDSEGLLILTTNKSVTRLLFSSEKPHSRIYLIMVQNEVADATLTLLRTGISIKIKNGESYVAAPVAIERVQEPTSLYANAGDPREAWPHTWLLITLQEGKYRQVRKMVLAARHRCLRLIRLSISNIKLGNIKPGEIKEIGRDEFYQVLGID